MTSKDRVLAAIRHEEPDRVPTGEWEFGREMVEPVLGKSTFRHEWAKCHALWQGRRDEVVNDWKTGLVKLAEFYQWDAVLLHNCIGHGTSIEAPEPAGENIWRNSAGDTITYSPETDHFFITEKAPRPAADPAAPKPPPRPAEELEPTDSELEVVRHVVRELGKTHFLLSAPLWGHPGLGYSDATRSEVENWVTVFEDPGKAGELRLKSAASPSLRRGIEIAKREGMDGVAWGCDYGCNTGPFISPEMFRIAVFPGLKAFCALIHEYGLVAIHHSCGNNQVLLDQIVEAGVDVYQSIQPEMDIVKMKKRYGKNLTLWGGVPAGDLISKTPAEVKAAGIKALRELKGGGGLIYGTSHSIMPMAKYENYLAMLEALKEAGDYAE
jgi:hypothetical protein